MLVCLAAILMSIAELALCYRFSNARFNCNHRNRFLAIFSVIRIKKPVFFDYIIFANISLVRRSLFARCTPYYESYNSNRVINIKMRVFAFSRFA
jgi:hypothetical protein